MVRIYESWEHPKRVNGEPDWYAAPAMLEVGEEHYYAALREGMAIEPVGEMLLRMLAWRRHNDAVRTRDVVMSVQRIRLRQAAQISDECRANMELLAEVLSRRGHIEQIMCAEVLRELGEFDFALDVLALAQTQCHPALARAVRTLCEHEDVRLGEVVRPPWLKTDDQRRTTDVCRPSSVVRRLYSTRNVSNCHTSESCGRGLP